MTPEECRHLHRVLRSIGSGQSARLRIGGMHQQASKARDYVREGTGAISHCTVYVQVFLSTNASDVEQISQKKGDQPYGIHTEISTAFQFMHKIKLFCTQFRTYMIGTVLLTGAASI